jgi:hypothetical protein
MTALMLSAHVRAAQTAVMPEPQMPDVLIWIDARNPAQSWVAITYPKVVPKVTAETHLANLLKYTGWAAANLKISHGSIAKTGENPMTSAEFSTPAAIQPQTGYLPIEPIILAFRDLNLVEVQYLTPATFVFRGLGDFENKHVRIKLNRGSNTYRYSISLKTHDFERLDLPGPQVPGEPKESADRGLRLTIEILVVALALTMAALAFIISARFVQKRRMRS